MIGQESFKTIDDSLMSNNEMSGKINKRKSGSPIKSKAKSPGRYDSNKSASRKINKLVNPKIIQNSPNKGSDGNFNIGLYGDDNNYLTKVNCEQLNLEFKWEDNQYDGDKFKTENQVETIEGIAGMVQMPLRSSSNEESKINDEVCLFDEDIRKGESISEKEDASSGQGSDERNNNENMFYPESQNMSPQRAKNVDMQTISVESAELDVISKKANQNEQGPTEVVETESKKQERLKLDNEILSIIGNINMKALQIKSKMGFKETKDQQETEDLDHSSKVDDPLSLS